MDKQSPRQISNGKSGQKYYLDKRYSPKKFQEKSAKNDSSTFYPNQSSGHSLSRGYENRSSGKLDLSKKYIKKDEQQVSRVKLDQIHLQNTKLKSENQQLRFQLSRLRQKQMQQLSQSNHNNREGQYKEKIKFYSREYFREPTNGGDLRGTIKKQIIQTNDAKQLKEKLETVLKQCKTYEQIISNLQHTVAKLTQQSKLSYSRHSRHQGRSGSCKKNNMPEEKRPSHEQLSNLKEKVNNIVRAYSELESKMHSSQLEWVIWKEQWITEKNIYLNKIKQLEAKLKLTNKF